MKKATLTRQLILEILLAVEEGEFSHIVIKSVLDKYSYLSNEDKTFIKRLSAGCIERRITLDYIIDQFSKTNVNKCKKVIKNILRMGVYQIYYMDSVPDSAAVDEAVKLSIDKGFINLKGFVNGVLRNIARSERIVNFNDLSIKYSVPVEIVNILRDALIDDPLAKREGVDNLLESVLQSSLDAQTLFGRVLNCDAHKCIESLRHDGIEAREYKDGKLAGLLGNVLVLNNVNNLSKTEAFKTGKLYIQDISSMISCALPQIAPGMKVLDLCAAPGGKSFNIASRLDGTGTVISCDLTDLKTDLISEGKERLGLSNVEVITRDALSEKRDFEDESFDLIIADLPCSGLGVMGRKLDLKYRVTKKDTEDLAKLQRDILKNNIRFLKPGGQLLYSTCTISKSENRDNYEFIKETLGLKPVSIEKKLAGAVSERTGGLEYIQLLPGVDEGDGFFAALFIK